MSSLRPTPTIECIAALRDLGFEVERVTERLVLLRRTDGRRVSIKRRSVLSPDELRVLLGIADVERDTFAEALARRAMPRELMIGETSGVRERPTVVAAFENADEHKEA